MWPWIPCSNLTSACLCCAVLCAVCSLQYNGGKDMTSGSFTSTADIDFFIDVDASGTELVIVSDNITTRHQVRWCLEHGLPLHACNLRVLLHKPKLPVVSPALGYTQHLGPKP